MVVVSVFSLLFLAFVMVMVVLGMMMLMLILQACKIFALLKYPIFSLMKMIRHNVVELTEKGDVLTS